MHSNPGSSTGAGVPRIAAAIPREAVAGPGEQCTPVPGGLSRAMGPVGLIGIPKGAN